MQTYTGIVQKGSRSAVALGYPTINIPLPDSGVSGIYAALVRVGEEEYEAAAYADQKKKVLEAHLFDFSKDLYGWNVKIQLMEKIREHKKFKSDEDQQKTIDADIAAVRTYFMNKDRKYV